MALNKINTIPYDFTTPGLATAGDGSSTLTVLAESGDIIGTIFDTLNKKVSFSTGGTTVPLAPQYEYAYDFATDGGAIGAIVLRGAKLPANFVVEDARWNPTVAFTSGGAAQISLGTRS